MSATCSRMYAEQVTRRSARFAIHFSTPWMCDCGCLSTQPWWRPYSVAWIVDRPRVCQSGERVRQLLAVLLDSLQRVLAGHLVRELEGPVARLERQQLSSGALQRGIAGSRAGRGGDRAQLAAAGRPSDLG